MRLQVKWDDVYAATRCRYTLDMSMIIVVPGKYIQKSAMDVFYQDVNLTSLNQYFYAISLASQHHSSRWYSLQSIAQHIGYTIPQNAVQHKISWSKRR